MRAIINHQPTLPRKKRRLKPHPCPCQVSSSTCSSMYGFKQRRQPNKEKVKVRRISTVNSRFRVIVKLDLTENMYLLIDELIIIRDNIMVCLLSIHVSPCLPTLIHMIINIILFTMARLGYYFVIHRYILAMAAPS